MRTYEESEELSHSDTEITLGMRSILGIFFGLVLICGVFFGFGYSLGRGNTNKAAAQAQTAPQTQDDTAAPAVKTVVEGQGSPGDTGADASTAKPSGAVLPPAQPAAAPAVSTALNTANTTLNTANTAPQSAMTAAGGAQATKASYTLPATTAAASPAQTPAVQSSATQSAAIMIQIAAVSRREDADVLVSALRNLGYSASVHSETTDQLLHVQIGPFATRGEAQAMRTKLLNDGYNAILK